LELILASRSIAENVGAKRKLCGVDRLGEAPISRAFELRATTDLAEDPTANRRMPDA
jgi:hypothetical protein